MEMLMVGAGVLLFSIGDYVLMFCLLGWADKSRAILSGIYAVAGITLMIIGSQT